MELSREFRLSAEVVEKDYVLGWVLAGISNLPEFEAAWVFKGGTCLKKCYFETYRFSEDLDFTLTGAKQINEPFLKKAFQQIAEWVYEQSGIEIPADTIRFEIYTNPRGQSSAQGRLGYRGPMMRQRGGLPRIKLDLTDDEVLVLEPALREVHHPYSDRPDGGIHARCYRFEEVFAEKIRALAERERPRDLYYVVNLHRHEALRPDRAAVLTTLEQKCAFKGISMPTLAGLENRAERTEIETEWGNMLGHQLPALPPFQQFWLELPAVFDWLHGSKEKDIRPSLHVATPGVELDEAWRPPAMAHAWHSSAPLEIIRFAAANHLCVDLAYQGTKRLIEPYSLRRTKDGHYLLHAVKHNTNEPRSYRVDRIEGSEVSSIGFAPRYQIELTPVGPLKVPSVERHPVRHLTSKVSRPKKRSRRPVVEASKIGPIYIFRCALCGKKFSRKAYDSVLNPHRNRQGFPCPGTAGIYEQTKY
jgi:predicted nucleotidyltransferase component of viral defense system